MAGCFVTKDQILTFLFQQAIADQRAVSSRQLIRFCWISKFNSCQNASDTFYEICLALLWITSG